jgi:hypothetical protein
LEIELVIAQRGERSSIARDEEGLARIVMCATELFGPRATDDPEKSFTMSVIWNPPLT